MNLRIRDYYRRRRNAGVCVGCGSKKERPDRVYCGVCRKQQAKLYRRKKGAAA